jgi:hypothetical protein
MNIENNKLLWTPIGHPDVLKLLIAYQLSQFLAISPMVVVLQEGKGGPRGWDAGRKWFLLYAET